MTTFEPIENYKQTYKLNFETFTSKLKGCNLTFELGDNLKNGSLERVHQAQNRALQIFKNLILENNLCLFEIYDYDGVDFSDKEGKFKNYLFEILKLQNKEVYKGPFEQLYTEVDESGKATEKIFEDKLECKIVIGCKKITYNEITKIINGIVNLEMGFEPIITQSVYIYDVKNNVGFRIYDDRGCHIWCSEREKLRKVYSKFKEWIVENEKETSKKIYE